MLFAALSRRMPADGGPYAIGAVGGGMAVTLFSYLGVETASVAAAEVRDPSRNVPTGDDPRHACNSSGVRAGARGPARDP
jgi:amino acid transporter